ncbi:MAG: protein of unknown function DUF2520-containing protein [Ferruginibacter sp.]|nr:protein of unknown function DUF2520-containing protein [Ferruginibacter sp.]
MKISLIGSGNVGSVLGRLMKEHGHTIVQVMSRDSQHASNLANLLNAEASDFSGIVNQTAELIVIAVADAGIHNVLPQITANNRLVVHTAGSVSKDVLQKYSSNYGVLYPLQSLRKEMDQIPPIPFLVDGSDEGCIVFLEEFARSLSSSVQRTTDEERLKLHTAAVIVSNFTNHLYAIAEDFCTKESLDFNMLKPLIMETAHRIQHASPAAVQTGPAVRKDIQTLDKHLRLLVNYPKLKTTYMRLTDSIMNP